MSDKRRGLGRGLGALIPSSAAANASGNGAAPSRPVDLFFPEARKKTSDAETLPDGTPWFSQTFGVGESTPDEITFATAPLKLRFESSSVIADSDGRGAVGTPEVYCEQ